MRDLLAAEVPESLWNMPKRGFNIDLVGLLRAHDCRLVWRYLGDDGDIDRMGLDRDEVIRWRSRFIAGDRNAAHRVWGLINLSAWRASRNAASSLASR